MRVTFFTCVIAGAAGLGALGGCEAVLGLGDLTDLPADASAGPDSTTGTDSGVTSGTDSGSSGGTDSATGSGDGGVADGDAGGNQDAGLLTATIYINTDDELYEMDPTTKAVTLIGPFAFAGLGEDAGPPSVTDLAVNAEGALYACTETTIYTATLPTTSPGSVTLNESITISGAGGATFYALAFTPAGALGPDESLVGGDSSGNLWAINPTTGAAISLGSFGPDPTNANNVLTLSGDLVFYVDGTGAFQGLGTIRSCSNPGAGKSLVCGKNSDYLAGVNMQALSTAYNSGVPAASLNNGIYGGSASTLGNGTGRGEDFGLAAVGGSVFAFSRYQLTGGPDAGPQLPAILLVDTSSDPSSGAGTVVPGPSSFTIGWSGAAVTTAVRIVVPAPPPPPPPSAAGDGG